MVLACVFLGAGRFHPLIPRARYLDKGTIILYNLRNRFRKPVSETGFSLLLEDLMVVTMEDVAEKAGVSKTTVSRIINEIPNSASLDTIERVRRTIEELDYVPNIIAASLKKLVTKTIGLIVGDIENPFFGAVIKGIETTLRNAGYNLILANSSYDMDREEELARVLLERMVDAIIFAPSRQKPGEWLQIASDRGVNIVLIDNDIPGLAVDHVGVDNFKASYEATQYLIDLGHKKLAMITGPHYRSTSSNRKRGFLSALEDRSIAIDQAFLKEGDYGIESGYEKTKELIELDSPPTALFIANNFMTAGAMKAIYEEGLKIPDDISILGFDDMYWYTTTQPPVSAIAQPAYDIGRVAAERVLRSFKSQGKAAPRKIELKTKLLIRKSTAAPKEK